jgi:hypothetical protein
MTQDNPQLINIKRSRGAMSLSTMPISIGGYLSGQQETGHESEHRGSSLTFDQIAGATDDCSSEIS